MTHNGKALLSGFEFEKQKFKIYFMDAQSYFDSQAHFNKWLKQLTEDEQRMIVDMLNEFRQQNLQQCNVSGALPPVDNRVMFADYIQRCVIERGQMTYPSLKDAIKAWDETTERFGGNDR